MPSPLILLIVSSTAVGQLGWQVFTILVQLFYLVVTFLVLLVGIKIIQKKLRRNKLHLSGIATVDKMSGLEFEQYIKVLLARKGFSGVRLTEQYDLGVDITAMRNGVTWGIQVKRYGGLVKADAVRQVVAALNCYGCDRSMVITNNYFSKQAKQLAKSNNCILLDRDKLLELMI